jgi:acetolactate synthase-1/2/3 large subunit
MKEASVKTGSLRPAVPIEIVPHRDSYIRELAPHQEEAMPASGLVPKAIPHAEIGGSAAALLVAALVDAGVDTFFGVPGGPVSPVFAAILGHPGARLVESRQETAAAFGAAGYHRASGRVPAVVVTAGPGATNAITGIVSAHLERVPMLVICGDVAWAAAGGKLLQDCGPEGIGIEEMLAKVTRATVRVAHARSAVSQGLAALRAATDPVRPGPALLVVPIDRGAAAGTSVRVEQTRACRVDRPERAVVEEAGRWLAEAERPLIVLGAGCRPHAAAMRRLVDALDVPFVTTPQAKGVVSELHPRSLRTGGLAASHWARRYTAAGVDVALALGTDLDDCSVGPTPYLAPGGRLVHVDVDPAVFGRNVPCAMGVVADAAAFAEALLEVTRERGLHNGRCSAPLRRIKGSSPFDVADFDTDARTPIAPHRVVADLQAAAGPSARFITDIGEHMLFALHYLTARDPGAFDIHLALGSMASGIAGAVGLAIGDRSRRAVCICGDGGMQMAGMELLTAMRERLPIVFAVFNDARYNMVYHGFKHVFGGEAPWDSPWVDFAAWAHAMGMPGVRITEPGQIDAGMLDRLTAPGLPVVLDVRIDRDVRIRGGGRNESLQHMSMLSSSANGGRS